ncbi:hypothetical protein N8I77_012388 [Diaporthe amygdali]|uniref:Uncharacterized protein n=1 Tax=Phomopsis amygdali TaxID=1214568 RepID=A0AAD9S2N9_PHOAM|nr:uncharacterized protein J7T55_000589 [Diaporthe amygdali]KAJ0110157.1 hypothetical protein J7T55_000589 [Diaporthe amygdali]KAK2597611.1 hypothetical protein N8I77_012388 [Diaporthe amygdali]
MRVHIPLSMASLPEFVSVVRSKIVEWNVVSSSTSWMQYISWGFLILALSFFLPLVALICFDFLLWIWRLIRPPVTANPSRRRRRESLKHPVTTS